MPIVYHYTTVQGLIGILSDRRIWFTDVRFMNDPSELGSRLNHALSHARDAQMRLIHDGKGESEECHLYGEVAAEKQNALDYMSSAFVFSMSGEPDSLTLWERYAARGGGYAIGLNIDKLKASLSGANGLEIRAVTCQYTDDQLRAHALESLQRMLEDYRTNRAEAAAGHRRMESLSILASHFWSRILSADFAWKHPAFAAEAEIRLQITDTGTRERKFRANGAFAQPYVELACPELPVCSVTVGPAAAPEVAELGVRSLLKKLGTQVPIRRSGIPYRSIGPGVP
jgi:hypothetical protein